MADTEVRRAIIVLSSGRAGTSLLTQSLAAMGMSLSEKLIEAGYGNPDGFFEDAEIVDIHKDLQAELGGSPRLPLPAGWMESDAVRKYRPRLRAVLKRELDRTSTIWGFKDPRTCAFLPLWLRLFNAEKVNPCFVLAVRNPAAVARSLARMTDISPDLAELMWLDRNCDALHYTAGDCFILHYEDWFTRGQELGVELQRYTELDRHTQGNLQEALAPIIKPRLNRAVHEPHTVRNAYVLRLYDILAQCRGSQFDRERLMQCVRDCREAMEGFRGWSTEALRMTQEAARASKVAQKANTEESAKVRQLQAQSERLQAQTERLQAQTERLQAQTERLQAQTERLQQEKKETEGAASAAAAQAAAQAAALTGQVEALRTEREHMLAELEQNELRQNACLQQVTALHAKVEELSIRRFAARPETAPAAAEVKRQGPRPTAASKEAAKPTAPVARPPAAEGMVSRRARLWRKLRSDPHGYFADSRITAIRPLRHLFPAR